MWVREDNIPCTSPCTLLQFAECTWTVTLVLLEVIDVPGIDRTIFLLLEMISFHVVLTSFPVTKSTFNLWGDKIMGQQHREKGTTDNILLS